MIENNVNPQLVKIPVGHLAEISRGPKAFCAISVIDLLPDLLHLSVGKCLPSHFDVILVWFTDSEKPCCSIKSEVLYECSEPQFINLTFAHLIIDSFSVHSCSHVCGFSTRARSCDQKGMLDGRESRHKNLDSQINQEQNLFAARRCFHRWIDFYIRTRDEDAGVES